MCSRTARCRRGVPLTSARIAWARGRGPNRGSRRLASETVVSCSRCSYSARPRIRRTMSGRSGSRAGRRVKGGHGVALIRMAGLEDSAGESPASPSWPGSPVPAIRASAVGAQIGFGLRPASAGQTRDRQDVTQCCSYRSFHSGLPSMMRLIFHSLGHRLIFVSRWIAVADVVMVFEVDQPFRGNIFFVNPSIVPLLCSHTRADKIVRYADVERAVRVVGEEVDPSAGHVFMQPVDRWSAAWMAGTRPAMTVTRRCGADRVSPRYAGLADCRADNVMSSSRHVPPHPYSSKLNGSSTTRLNALSHCAPSAPSTTR